MPKSPKSYLLAVTVVVSSLVVAVVIAPKRNSGATAAMTASVHDSAVATGVRAAGGAGTIGGNQQVASNDFLVAYQRAFDLESKDPAWSDSAEQLVKSRLADDVLPAGSRIQSVDCRTSMCRIETTHDDSATSDLFARGILMSPERQIWNAAQFSSRGDSGLRGRSVLITYLARAGHQLPVIRS